MPTSQKVCTMPDNSSPTAGDLRDRLFEDMPVDLVITVGRARVALRDLMSMDEGAVLALDRRIEDPVELWIGDRLVARGHLEEAEDGPTGALAVRLTEVVSTGRPA